MVFHPTVTYIVRPVLCLDADKPSLPIKAIPGRPGYFVTYYFRIGDTHVPIILERIDDVLVAVLPRNPIHQIAHATPRNVHARTHYWMVSADVRGEQAQMVTLTTFSDAEHNVRFSSEMIWPNHVHIDIQADSSGHCIHMLHRALRGELILPDLFNEQTREQEGLYPKTLGQMHSDHTIITDAGAWQRAIRSQQERQKAARTKTLRILPSSDHPGIQEGVYSTCGCDVRIIILSEQLLILITGRSPEVRSQIADELSKGSLPPLRYPMQETTRARILQIVSLLRQDTNS